MAKVTFAAVFMMLALAAGLHASEDLEVAWQEYLANHPLGVQTKAEYGLRKSIFNETHARIKKHNSKKGASFQMAHNAFSVLTEEEKQIYTGALKPVRPNGVRGISIRAVPTSIDYRADACMSPVRYQGGCGSCWAFSATAVVEFGKCKRSGGSARDFSEQQIVDCSRPNGCSGGWEHEAWQYLASNGGQAAESSYSYTAVAGTCRFSTATMSIGAQISSSSPVQWVGSVDAMKTVLSSGRILSIYMQLPSSFFNYRSGVFNDANCVPNYAHAMNVVGYGNLNGVDYWVVRNSWSAGWGAAGYVLVRRGVDLCMIERYSRTTNIA